MSHTLEEYLHQLREAAKQKQVIYPFILLHTLYKKTADFGRHQGWSDFLDTISGDMHRYLKRIIQMPSNHTQRSSTEASEPTGWEQRPEQHLPSRPINDYDYYQQGA